MDDHQHVCPECERRCEYRLVRGSSYEGISIREVYLNDKNEIEEWSDEPILTLAPTKSGVIEDIIFGMEDLDDMLAATKRPILDEIDLESRIARGEQ